MTPSTLLELAAATAAIAAGLVLYRHRARTEASYGSQSAVLLFAVGAILLIHGLGGLEYHRHGLFG